ncbi:hypothetical protein KAFR_0E01470 [Kazachstania africana CBS 2517]|uniref:Uncharacterized protein n=1 Tax=Kazachstania africana (strain ATCC 22294 / BCRC 22015 / CBS 2517 / CECT 1963 / NBRC 1671 / NRRL Y-8276) TaxID=1071382 RepID=H2AVA1_KAZAF|nr:hypothetical protein KAFR_0E01470 [Kazachstania africana CBS 2517]CCF58301.1 hypothetical protein KAFR_0E01470 [Kazachstania africana CBS 2517]
MSNFFRDSSLGFKPRSNIFSKLRVKDPISAKYQNGNQEISLMEDEGDSSMINDILFTTNKDDTSFSEFNSTEPSKDAKGNIFQLNTSTPKVSKKSTIKSSDLVDDEDFEITEVRTVPNCKTAGSDGYENQVEKKIVPKPVLDAPTRREPTAMSNIDTSSNDVLLEAFTNTQRICVSLKHELQNQQTENTKLKSDLKSYQTDTRKIQDKITEYNDILTSLRDKSKELMEQKQNDKLKFQELRKTHENFESKIKSYREDIESLKTSLNSLKNLKKDTELQLAKKNQEIEYLQRELDDCSGQLSEEKIKNDNLLQNISDNKKEFATLLDQHFSEYKTYDREQIEELQRTMAENLKNELQTKLNTLASRSSTEWKNIAIELQEKYLKLVLIPLNLLPKTNNTNIPVTAYFPTLHLLSESIKEGCATQRKAHEETLRKLTEYSVCFTDVHEDILKQKENMLGVLTSSLDSTNESVQNGNNNLSSRIENMTSAILGYKDELIHCKTYEKAISELESQIAALQQQKMEHITALGMKEAQHEELIEKFEAQNNTIIEFEKTKADFNEKLNLSESKLNYFKNECAKLNETKMSDTANFENKIASQNRINNVLMSENDTLKQRITELEESKNNFEKDQNVKFENIQKFHEQLQKLNVEIVQMKAHELELAEENRALKKTIDDSRLNFDENVDELRYLKQQLVLLKAEKQELVAEKLELQDKYDSSEKIVKNMRKTVATLKTKVTAHEAEIKTSETTTHERQQQWQKKVDTKNPAVKKTVRSSSSERKLEGVEARRSKSASTIGPKHSNKTKTGKCSDEFDFPSSSSSNDDLELTNPSPIASKVVKRGPTIMRPPANTVRKKLLLVDDDDNSKTENKRKRRRN